MISATSSEVVLVFN